MRFRERLWLSIRDVYDAILNHPFIGGMRDGTLPMEAFRFYVVQDALYLDDFARAVALVGVKAEAEDAAVLLSAARDTLTFERASLHEFLLREWGVSYEEIYRVEMMPVNHAYVSYLLSTACLRPFHEGLAAILPCFWVYLEVGKELLRHGSPVETYQRWINTYSSREYEETVENVVKLMDKVGERIDEEEAETIFHHFRLSTIYEYLFWDSSYRMESWPFKTKTRRRV